MKKFILLFFLCCAGLQAQVALAPFTKSQFFDNSGHPLSGGRLFTYAAGTTTPLATYRDSAGTILNTNPVVLDSAGRADVWLTSAAYKLVLQNAFGVQIWSEDGVTSSNIALLGLNNTWTGTNAFNGGVTLNSSALFNAGLTSAGPGIFNGGGSLNGTWGGSPLFGGIPNFSAGFLAASGNFSGIITSTLPTGTAPFNIASATQVPNLNASQLEGFTWEIPGQIGLTTRNSAKVTTLDASINFQLAGGTPQTGMQGTDTNLLTAGTFTGATGVGVCKDANLGVTTVGCQTGGFTKFLPITICAAGCTVTGTPCTTGNTSYDQCSQTFTLPSSFADTGYTALCNGVGPHDASNAPNNGRAYMEVSAKTINTITLIAVTTGAAAIHWDEYDCNLVHP